MSNMTRPVAGQPISASEFRRLIDEVRANRIIEGPGIKTRRTTHGTHVESKSVSMMKVEYVDSFPWMLKAVYNEDSDEVEYKWKNKFLQVGYRTFNFDDETYASEFSEDDSSADGAYYVEVKLAGESGDPLAVPQVTVKASDTYPEDDTERGIFHFYIGRVKEKKQVAHITQVPILYMYI